ncbi:MotA/TolQ/ExbB proton channel family protein (plasmid) [Parasedimentitalea marina]|uniref:MotA/TolQ/ExbB proton channel family protein n=1 Tax=Parasedimentitalea marina TaxID=2483033 RepID=A0A3T0NAP5_9RHOB|nr:MotA/TolQ/ExbB proton channel family protein [Parasedimentitalea marina]AZV81063.1 MotA/TolQ/ExbB proton channel family protein [Parasedimentitalea marina]
MTAIWEMLITGGPVIMLLAVMSVFSLSLIGVKLAQLWRVRSGEERRDRALEFWQAGEPQKAISAMSDGRAPADRVMSYAMQALTEGLSGPRLEGELMRRGNAEVMQMNSLIRLLELIAMVSPLLGLLGTVLGMIQSFQELELAQGAANASVLAGGIWQALLTTAAGLLVAIPAAIAAGLYAARIDGAAQQIESAVGRLLLVNETR